MFASFFRRVFVLVSSCVVATAAATLATVPPEELTERLEPDPGPEPRLAHSRTLLSPIQGPSAPLPRPGQVSACAAPGRDEVVTLPDTGAPEGGRPLWIRRPSGPDSADLPVLYLLHGSASTHETLMDEDVGALLDRQMCRSGVEFVIAAPYGQESGGATTEWGDAADGGFALESFVTGAAVEAVEGEHTRPRALRAVGGFSMGGYGAAALALRHPDLYTQVVSWAGYFRVDDPYGVFGGDTGPHSPDRLLGSQGVRDLRFMLVEGTEDHTPLQRGSIHGEAERFAGLLTERGMTVATLHPHGGHDFTTWKRSFPDAVDFLVSGWSSAP
ncbi:MULTISPECIES: alpha/beta hydrolase [Nocardiopsis]|uniref:Esterase n=1 Tax=Nocardiopsis dassonvillei (strain ATCC 23218 / DSM 43111 / CIP 107115 / JCM 7437 / KCTC 9190 / NBRC 14626 / NCTC 10488 / NRRL B-5397 / IMRU 509) TaxID=446468 RepID=D7AW64_NOCDD|nr:MULTISPECIES: alpha/beta hydrolase-fold protein [Nocardiopsis]ADH69724.1 putative esterase [Nocardiopsis dassonvillei subsp. dassonvillei DSM 43111]NKY77715.1 esterase family protein [Nocardiopsis dassonvillei]VEI90237.1 Predicted hydrolase of the alpha/beta superfamily [Nocardiopsis dassonvillei]